MSETVLVVDDDSDFLEMMDAVLTSEGYSVASCAASTEAQQKAQQLQPAVIIVDLRMRDLSGWQVIEQLKAEPTTACLPVIFCTAAVSEALQQVARLRQWGCEVLLKPFELRDLLDMVAKAVAKRRSRHCL